MFILARRLLLFMTLTLIAISGYYLYLSFSSVKLPAKLDSADSQADVEIKKFTVAHEKLGRKDWELKADYAQVNRTKDITHLKKVEMEFFLENNQQFWVSADTGVLKNNSKNFELEGNVKLIAESSLVFENNHQRKHQQTASN